MRENTHNFNLFHRCKTILPLDKSKLFMHYMWTYGRYERELFNPRLPSTGAYADYYPFMMIGWKDIKMTKDTIWLSNLTGCCAFNRTKDYSLFGDDWIIHEDYINYDAISITCEMVLCNDVIITSHGYVYLFINHI